MDKFEAIKYLKKYSVYGNEWQRTGMWEAVEQVLIHKGKITERWLKKLLKLAEDR